MFFITIYQNIVFIINFIRMYYIKNYTMLKLKHPNTWKRSSKDNV